MIMQVSSILVCIVLVLVARSTSLPAIHPLSGIPRSGSSIPTSSNSSSLLSSTNATVSTNSTAKVTAATNSTMPSRQLPPSPKYLTRAPLPFLPPSGESSLIDGSTLRVFWSSSANHHLPNVAPFLHFKAVLLTLLLYGPIVYALVKNTLSSLPPSSAASSLPSPLQFLFLFFHRAPSHLPSALLLPLTSPLLRLILLFYLLEALFSSSRRFLSNVKTPSQTQSEIEAMRESQPKVTWKMRCYHNEPRRGSPTTKKVFTTTVTRNYQFDVYRDASSCSAPTQSPPLPSSPPPPPFMKLRLTKICLLADAETRTDYFRQQNDFINEYRNSDTHFDFTLELNVDNFQSKMMALRANRVPVKTASLYYFWLATALGLGVPYRHFLTRISEDMSVQISKEVTSGERASTNPSSKDDWGRGYTLNAPAIASYFPRTQWWTKTDKTETDEVVDEKFRNAMYQLNLYPPP